MLRVKTCCTGNKKNFSELVPKVQKTSSTHKKTPAITQLQEEGDV